MREIPQGENLTKLTELGYETGMCEQVEQPLVVFS